jgi:hypothetical protein
VRVFFLCTDRTIAACECDTDIVGGDDVLVGSMDLDRGRSRNEDLEDLKQETMCA